METVANFGTRIIRWSEVRKNFIRFYERIAIRNLKFLRTKKSLECLERFLDKVVGTRYSLSLNKVLRRRETIQG